MGLHSSSTAPAAASAAASQSGAHPQATPAAAETEAGSSFWRKGLTVAGGVAAFALGAGYALAEEEADHGLHAPHYPWPHDGFFSSYDHASIRRGHQVCSHNKGLYLENSGRGWKAAVWEGRRARAPPPFSHTFTVGLASGKASFFCTLMFGTFWHLSLLLSLSVSSPSAWACAGFVRTRLESGGW